MTFFKFGVFYFKYQQPKTLPDSLLKSFSFFKHDDVTVPDYKVSVVRIKSPEKLKKFDDLRFFFKTKNSNVFIKPNLQISRFDQNHFVVIRRKNKRVFTKIYGLNEDFLKEIAYLTMLSFSGEAFDRSGWHRLHAAGIEDGTSALIYPRAPNHGKSTFALRKLVQSQNSILGDESVLTDGRTVRPFPLLISLKHRPEPDPGATFYFCQMNKRLWGMRYLYSIPADRIAADTQRFKIFLATGDSKMAFLISFVLGLGVVQMQEFVVRPDNVFRWIRILVSRMIVGIRLWSKIGFHDFDSK